MEASLLVSPEAKQTSEMFASAAARVREGSRLHSDRAGFIRNFWADELDQV